VKVGLRPPDEYYRLTRARELRRKAGGIERHIWRWLGGAGLVSLVLGVYSGHVGSCVVVLVIGAWAVGSTLSALRATHLRAQADRLEAEHQVRYGELPAGKEEHCLFGKDAPQ
jgi:hypothetical protein